MPVVINEFEVVPESPAPPSAGSTAAQGQSDRPPLDLDKELATRRARAERVRAY
jgi:hypothetical protein